MTTQNNNVEGWEEKAKKVCIEVEEEWQASGLSCGLYGDYAIEVAKRLVASHTKDLLQSALKEEVMRFKEEIQERANKIPPNLLLNEIVNYAYDRSKQITDSSSLSDIISKLK